MDNADKWDNRFISLAKIIACWSKDPSTKVGAVIVRPDKSVAATGFNGFPAEMSDDPDLYLDSEYKNQNVVHAEENALNFLQQREDVKSSYTVYTSFPPCPNCVELLHKAGIRRVVTVSPSVHFSDPSKSQEWVNKWSSRFIESLQKMKSYDMVVRFVKD